jgi:hypothetical protein
MYAPSPLKRYDTDFLAAHKFTRRMCVKAFMFCVYDEERHPRMITHLSVNPMGAQKSHAIYKMGADRHSVHLLPKPLVGDKKTLDIGTFFHPYTSLS